MAGDILKHDGLLKNLDNLSLLPSTKEMILMMQRCAKEKNLNAAKKIHMLLKRSDLEDDTILGNHLVNMFAICRSFCDAQPIFDKLPQRKEFAWTSLIQGYIDVGDPHQTLHLFEQMHDELVNPAMYAFPPVLKACSMLKCLEKGREIHSEIVVKGLESNDYIGNSLLDMYAKSGSLSEANVVFEQRRMQNTISWNALITGYVENGHYVNAVSCFEQMQEHCWPPDSATFVCVMKAFCTMGVTLHGYRLHNEIIKRGFELSPVVGTALVDMYFKLSMLIEAQDSFHQLPIKSVVSWTALMLGYSEHGAQIEALNSFKQMQLQGLYPDQVAFVCSLKACGSIGATGMAQEIHIEITKAGFENHFMICNILIDVYAKCGLLIDMEQVFDGLSSDRNVVSWTALIAGYAEHAEGCEVAEMLDDMHTEGVSPNAATYTCCLKCCGSTGTVDKGQLIHSAILEDQKPSCFSKDGEPQMDSKLVNALVDMYSKGGCLQEAQKVFDLTSKVEIITCNSLIIAYAKQAQLDPVVCILSRMEEEHVDPDRVTFLGTLSACSHAGFADIGIKYFQSFTIRYVDVEHYNCVIDMLGRVHQLDNVTVLIDNMPFQPNLVTWGSMLNACRNVNNVELGKQALDSVLAAEHNFAPALVSMSNIYADAQMWEDVEMITSIIKRIKCP